MKIDGNNVGTWLGLVVIETRGFFDMPARISPHQQDWGDSIVPLLDPEDIFYDSMSCEVDFLYDPRVKPGSSALNAISALISADECELDLQLDQGSPFQDFDKFTVRFDHSKDYRDHGTVQRFTAGFYIQKPHFIDYWADFYPFSTPVKFGWLYESTVYFYSLQGWLLTINSINGIGNRGTARNSVNSSNIIDPDKYQHRDLNVLEIDMTIGDVGEIGRRESTIALQSFKKYLSLPGIKKLYYHGQEFNFYVSDGFVVTRKGSIYQFTLKINLI